MSCTERDRRRWCQQKARFRFAGYLCDEQLKSFWWYWGRLARRWPVSVGGNTAFKNELLQVYTREVRERATIPPVAGPPTDISRLTASALLDGNTISPGERTNEHAA